MAAHLAFDRIVQRLLPDVEYHQNRYARELDRLVTPGSRWLDLGAGTRIHGGWGGTPQADLCRRAARVVGCDPVGEHLDQNPYLTEAVTGRGEALPFPDASFDLVSANMVLEHLSDPVSVFREVRRVLVTGGAFVFVTPNRGHPAVRFMAAVVTPQRRRRIARMVDAREIEHIFLTHYAANDVRQLEVQAQEAGFVSAQVEAFSSYPILRRPAALTVVECGFIRLTGLNRLRQLRSNLLGVFYA